MDTEVSQSEVNQPRRRSTRQSSTKALHVELKPREPLKRTKRRADDQTPAAAVNGSKDLENVSEDEESPSKKSRLETGGAMDGKGDADEMDVQESEENLEEKEDQEMILQEDSIHTIHKQKICHGSFEKPFIGDKNLTPRVFLERYKYSNTEDLDTEQMRSKRVEPSRKGHVASNKSTNQQRPIESRPKGLISTTSMADYKKKMEAKAKSTGMTRDNHHVAIVYPTYKTQLVSNIPAQKQTDQLKKQGVKKSATIKGGSLSSSRGFIWYLWRLVLLLLLSAAALLAYKVIPVPRRPAGGGGHPPTSVKPGEFVAQLSLLETQFPSQRSELWERSRIHLERHLRTARPTEPVSLILTAGRSAERTLHCLAQGLASAFSSALNASVLHIDGASKANEDSDQVKLDIDNQLRGAFEGNKPVAVIHRFEELPPGSTLIFYRYCDHENAAYKQVFLAFTVLLPQEDLAGQQSLKDVEEMVHDYINKRFVGSSSQTAFNRMDADKLSGLWSRISHVVLPVAAESEVERKGC
ncbi:uncharacterized protein ACJ7VT_002099 [Polymixia lowei]